MRKSGAVWLLTAVLLVSGCGNGGAQDDHAGEHAAEHEVDHHLQEHGSQHKLSNGDLQELTSSGEVLPSFLDGKSNDIRAVYSIAAQITDVLPYIPCYCGCGESAGHESNLNCFIKEVREDGSILWDDHGTRCGVCLDIAVESAKLKSEGKSLSEIREAVDAKYENGYAKPTPTPMPAS
ncbi:PCYCGC motif-containing (lipo)protein [Paenibacillus sp. JSM ZJ436]|uniref:PCYCGC motif-containing (lipo)protein n=1 Tax=Paenibacillus sp. JSM ZJ436 TaxID=3376190 RepID=UPI0037B5E29A